MSDLMNDVAVLQTEYQKLIDEQRLSKKAMCDLVIPFRDKYGLQDSLKKSSRRMRKLRNSKQILRNLKSTESMMKWQTRLRLSMTALSVAASQNSRRLNLQEAQ